MKRKVLFTAVALGFASGAKALPDPTPPTDIAGSDTLREITVDAINACGLGGSLVYVGGGSSLGGTKMTRPPASGEGVGGEQQVAPQSRFMNGTECSAFATNQGQGLQIGLDGIAVFHDFHQFTTCQTLRYAGCMTVQDLNSSAALGYGNGTVGIDDGTGSTATLSLENGNQYCFRHWADVLRIIYGGQHAHLPSTPAAACDPNAPAASPVANKRCNSDVRRTLVDSWANMFDQFLDDGAGGCTDDSCLRLSRAWRRDDLSGTTDTFLSLIGLRVVNDKPFCNGFEYEDNDPVRRACSASADPSRDPDSVCAPLPFRNRNVPFGADGSPSGVAGTTAPTPPGAGAVGDLGLVLAISLPQRLDVQYDPNFCGALPTGGAFRYAPMPTVVGTNPQRCPDGNARRGGNCRWPVYASGARAGQFNCKVRRTNRPGSITWNNFDARAYNLVVRDPITGVIQSVPPFPIPDPRWGGGGHYRIHMTAPADSQTATPFVGTRPTCMLPDATQQIGCLVQSDPCSIGYAGLGAEDVDTTPEEIAVAGQNTPWLLRSPVDTDTSELTAGNDQELEPRVSTVRRLSQPQGAACAAGTGDYDIRYPLARVIWLNSSKGFGTLPGFSNITNTVDSNDVGTTPDLLTRENDLVQCFANRAVMDPILENRGFITLSPLTLAERVKTCP